MSEHTKEPVMVAYVVNWDENIFGRLTEDNYPSGTILCLQSDLDAALAKVKELEASLRELIVLAEIGDADQDEENWHPVLERARAAIAKVEKP